MSRHIRTYVRRKINENDNDKDNLFYVQCKFFFFLVFLFLRVILAVCISLLFYRTSSKVLLCTVRDTCNNFLVQQECSYYIFRIIQP